MIKMLSLALLLIVGGRLFAQSPYQISPVKDGILSGGGLALAGLSTYMEGQVNPLTSAEIAQLDPMNINGLDQPATNNWNRPVQKLSDLFLVGSLISPFALLAGKQERSEWFTIGVLGFEAYSLTYGLTIMTKVLTLRPRPFLYNNLAPASAFGERDSRFALFSGHASLSAVGCFFAAKLYNDYHPDSKWKWPIWGLAATVPAFTSYFRVKGGKHFITDVVTGYAVGALIGWGIPALHKTKSGKASFGAYPTLGGMGVICRF